jgi:hypothetical protein
MSNAPCATAAQHEVNFFHVGECIPNFPGHPSFIDFVIFIGLLGIMIQKRKRRWSTQRNQIIMQHFPAIP